MRRLKKTIALILSAAIVSSLCIFSAATPALAEETTSLIMNDEELSLVKKLTALGVITNEYEPTAYAKRRDMAKIIASYIGLPNGTEATSPFSDVSASDVAIGAISGLYNMGIITGDENKKFCPDDYVTYDEALVFIINAIGHKMFAQRSGGYPTGYHRIAIQLDMLEDLRMASGKDDAYVIDIYKMLDAALSAALVETVYYGDGDVQYTLSGSETFLSANYGVRKYRGRVTGNSLTRLTSHDSSLKEEQIEIEGTVYDTIGYNYGYFLGYTVDYYLSDNDKTELIYIEETPRLNNTVRIDADDILTSKTTTDRIYYEDGESDKEYHIQLVANSDADVIYNSECYIGYGWISNVLPQKGYIEALDNNNDGIYEVLFVSEYDTVIVKNVDTFKEIIVDEITGDTLTFASDVEVYYAENSKLTPFASITVGSILGIAKNKSGDEISKIFIANQVAEGTVTGFNTEDGYEINGEYYEVSDDYTGLAITVGMSGEFALDIYGDIIAYTYTEGGDSVLAVPVAIQYKSTGFDKTITLKIFTESGNFLEIPLNDKVRIDNVLYDVTNDSEQIEVLAKLCGAPDSEGNYVINKSYLIMYTTNNDKKINSIDMGGNGNSENPVSGRVNIFADHYKIVRSSYEKILILCKDTIHGDSITSRQSQNTVFFLTPPENEIGDTDKYSIATKLELNKWYADESVSISGDDPVRIENVTAYNFGATDFRTVDALLVRGGGGTGAARSLGATTSLNFITHVTSAAGQDGIVTGKLYQGKKSLGVLAEKVAYTTLGEDGELKADLLTCDVIVAQNLINEGDVVQLGYNSNGEISSIKAISDYDHTTNTIIPVFKKAGVYISQSAMFYEPNANFVVGTVDLCDAVSGTLAFTAGTHNLVASVEQSPTVLIYYSDSDKVAEGILSDVQPGDNITMRIYNCYSVKEIIVFR